MTTFDFYTIAYEVGGTLYALGVYTNDPEADEILVDYFGECIEYRGGVYRLDSDLAAFIQMSNFIERPVSVPVERQYLYMFLLYAHRVTLAEL